MNKFDISQFKPCKDGVAYYATQTDSLSAWNNCNRGDWMLWIANELQVDEKLMHLAAGKCANTVRHLMTDDRSKAAVDAAIAYGNGEISREELIKAAYAAAEAAVAYAAYADRADAAYAAAYAAARAAYNAAWVADAYSIYAAAYYAAENKEENQLQTADICREVLTKAVMEKIDIKIEKDENYKK